MEGEERRTNIIKLLTESEEPITGSNLAKTYSVSRQVIVQDIALLRAKGCKIISTSNGYMIYETKKEFTKLLAVKHSKHQIKEELEIMVDFGATIVNVMVVHPVYGEITANLMISSRKHIDDFMKKLQNNESVPLMRLKNGEHYHLIKASNPKILDLVEKELKLKGFLM
ncbi:transcriptional regulator [Vallitalea longa]|uniref:Transcriptional regulator n=1 Tax=Vallitalea longa TaxID=2936439 RepID=A0A9W5YFJ8_9FIRM|nr:transcription repressor NadR [Vallitalea longa]GKX31841.1 transcriptional regulator [Vallitalea longa]